MSAVILSALEERLDEPTARGLAHAVSRAVRDGTLTPGAKLPSIRTVATQLGLSPATVSASWALLARSGLLRTEGRRGTTIADMQTSGSPRYRRALEHDAALQLDLSTGVPDSALLPDLSRALKYLTTAATPGSYLDEPVLPELLEALRADWPYPAEEMTVVDGAMDALELAARSFIRFADRVIVEHPCFPPLLDLLEAIGAVVVGVPLDGQGMCVQPLADALAQPIGGVFLQPRGQNPTGVSLTPTRARQIAAVLRKSNAPVIEDDSAGAVAATPSISLGKWIPNQTVHVRSFSKSHGPDLRLAAVSGPRDLIHQLVGRRQLGQGWSSRLLQRILLRLLTDSATIAQVHDARTEYARRRALIVACLADRDINVGGNDGINIWVPVNEESAAIVRLASQGIGVTPGSPFAVTPEQTAHIRVTTGLIAHGHAELADQIAAAAHASTWSGAR